VSFWNEGEQLWPTMSRQRGDQAVAERVNDFDTSGWEFRLDHVPAATGLWVGELVGIIVVCPQGAGPLWVESCRSDSDSQPKF
jgi:hypothetical protein